MINAKPNLIFQFRIELEDTEPLIWRRIQVPSKSTFWDLHVAIQDAMGWYDLHLHAFRVRVPHSRTKKKIGIPMEESPDLGFLPGWEISLATHLTEPGQSFVYEYDFGDGWEHEIIFEGILIKDKDSKYPRCLAGERACPPEDCGGVGGYYELLEILGDPERPEYPDMIEWLEGHLVDGLPYDSETFDPGKVEFSNPKKRLKMVLEG